MLVPLIIFILSYLIIALSVYFYFFRQKFTPEPKLHGRIVRKSLGIGEIKRSYSYFFPNNISGEANILFIFHGAKDTGLIFRKRTGYEFDKIAEHESLIVVYPDGYKKSWNDCRKQAKYPAKVKGVNDFEFINEIKAQVGNDHNIKIAGTFLFGYSNGGQLVNRICLEYPEWVDAASVVAANLPVEENLDCKPKNSDVPMILISGTMDKTNPYNGGLVNVLGIKKLGHVRSWDETAKYWCGLSDYKLIKSYFVRPGQKRSKTIIEKQIWENSQGRTIILFTVHGGGHTIPNKEMNFPRILGLTNHDINSYKEIWAFFKGSGA